MIRIRRIPPFVNLVPQQGDEIGLMAIQSRDEIIMRKPNILGNPTTLGRSGEAIAPASISRSRHYLVAG